MSEPIIIAIISGSFTLAGIAITLFVNWRLGRIRKDINGRLTELLNLTRNSSTAKGNLEGRAELKEEQKNK